MSLNLIERRKALATLAEFLENHAASLRRDWTPYEKKLTALAPETWDADEKALTAALLATGRAIVAEGDAASIGEAITYRQSADDDAARLALELLQFVAANDRSGLKALLSEVVGDAELLHSVGKAACGFQMEFMDKHCRRIAAGLRHSYEAELEKLSLTRNDINELDASKLSFDARHLLMRLRTIAADFGYYIDPQAEAREIALKSLARPLAPPAIEVTMTIWFHGGSSYSTDGRTPERISSEHHNILQVFLKEPRAFDTEELERKSGVTNVSRAFKDIMTKYPNFARAMRTPGKKKTGYFIRILHHKHQPQND